MVLALIKLQGKVLAFPYLNTFAFAFPCSLLFLYLYTFKKIMKTKYTPKFYQMKLKLLMLPTMYRVLES